MQNVVGRAGRVVAMLAILVLVTHGTYARERSGQHGRTIVEQLQGAKRFVVRVLHRLIIPPAPEPAPATSEGISEP